MNQTDKPYAPPSDDKVASHQASEQGAALRVASVIGSVLLGSGLLVLAYGAVAFWLIQSLPPNGGPTGRLPSVYVMAAGMLAALIGLILRDVPFAGRGARNGGARNAIPTSVGMLLLLALVAVLIMAISRT